MEELEQNVPEIQEPQDAPATFSVVDIRFRSGGKTYFFDPGNLPLVNGDDVIIDTSRGPEYGVCTSDIHTISEKELVSPLRSVLRKATPADMKIVADNREKEKRAFGICQQKIAEHKLDMQLVSAECAFDGSKILFFFTADGRVDFRDLVKTLAAIFRTRIELRQIGVRDKAKMVGGLGVCGRPFCCREFLDDFQPVSIKMAKTQNLSLNPAKISGTCGRLMCCLKYEQEAYEDLLKTAPKAESFVDTPDGRGTVVDVNLLKQSVKVRMEDEPETIGCYKNCDICVLRSGKAKKNDPPIPKDVAPLSGNRPAAEKKSAHKFDRDMPVLEPVILRSEAINTPVRDPSAKESTPTQGEAPSRPANRRRKKPAAPQNDAAPQKSAKPNPQRDNRNQPRRKPEKAKAEEQPESRPEAEGGEKKARSNPRRRHYRKKPKSSDAPESKS